ncbi:MAG: peptidoglycan DD-metalloendopeptidase family protein [Proteobacteria bacterium]|nr:peptidoglycan DD-metalloendopeptidase family protein [Pseudomonadota bacterium]
MLDLTGAPRAERTSTYSVGRYDEDRRGMYTTPLFEGARTLHMGIDLGAPAGTPVYACWDGIVESVTDLVADGDYGPTIVVRHDLERTLWTLHGHLERASLELWRRGDAIARGAVVGALGDEHENGGWPPHVHFQLSFEAPVDGDIPGVVRVEERESARAKYPDPRLVLGALY